MASSSRTNTTHGTYGSNSHSYKLVSEMNVKSSDDQIEQLKLMKDRIDRAFQSLVTEIERDIAVADKQTEDSYKSINS